MSERTSVVWLRRDLRLDDNVALAAAARQSDRIAVAFVVDPALLREGRFGAPLVDVFFSALHALRKSLRAAGSDLVLLEGDPASALAELCAQTGARSLFYNEDYEPAAVERDARVTHHLEARGISVRASADHVYFGAHEIAREDGSPYRVFTPYKRRWLENFRVSRRLPVSSARACDGKLLPRAQLGPAREIPVPGDYGFAPVERFPKLSEDGASECLRSFADGPMNAYDRARDLPGVDGTSHLSAHLRAGTIGIRTCVEAAANDVWLSELIWRDFYQMILRRFPRVADGPFLPAAAGIEWRNAPDDLLRWSRGLTGYPLVDAAMRQLNRTGWMHNRLRMIAASFLSKHLLIDWRLGERYFEQHLIDADLAANNGGWQWSASTGNDPVPYFRIFNPVLQSQKFDPQGTFIRAMIPEFCNVAIPYAHEPWKSPEAIPGYPERIVEHRFARERALAVYSRAMKAAR